MNKKQSYGLNTGSEQYFKECEQDFNEGNQNLHEYLEEYLLGFGNICGAHNPKTDFKVLSIAGSLYEQIRSRKNDYIRVAENSGFSKEQTKIIKDYIFYNPHDLPEGYVPFSPSYEMAESWRRLSEKHRKLIQPHEILLLKHEAKEIELLMSHPDWTQQKAYEEAEKLFNYTKASDDFYENIFSNKSKREIFRT